VIHGLFRRTPSFVALLLVVSGLLHAASPRDLTIAADDGVSLKATYYPAAGPGPGVLLLHMCNTDRRSWAPLGPQLADAGIHALALDYRGFGESGGKPYASLTPAEATDLVRNTWPADIDRAFRELLAQPGVDPARIGVAGGSCGVAQAAGVARRHPEVRAMVLLAGPIGTAGRHFVLDNPWMPIFTAAADDDQYDDSAPPTMRWLTELGGNPRNKFVGFADGRHGTEIFGPHPELPRDIVAWLKDTLITTVASPDQAPAPLQTPVREFWTLIYRGELVKAAEYLQAVRARDPKVVLFPELDMNFAGYEQLQANNSKAAVALFKMNVEAYPDSANAQDSLGDGYVADGQPELALQAAEKCLSMLDGYHADEQTKAAIRQSAEDKIRKLRK
jgi:pimeloyl-ACP methyl ester carboxylesterase